MKKILIGKVISSKMDQTALVEVVKEKKHPLYGKRYNRSVKYFAHNPENQYIAGDNVKITENRPISKNKNWIISSKVTK